MKYFGRNQLGEIDLKRGDHYVNAYSPGFGLVDLPDGERGPWKLAKRTLTKDHVGLSNLRLIRDGRRERVVPPGTYTMLHYNRAIVMSDTPAESHEHSLFYQRAKGRLLIAGLGIGFVLKAVLSKPKVEEVTVVEKSADLIGLVRPHITDDRVEVINADIHEWEPHHLTWWDVAWFDIWSDICQDNKREMVALKKRYRRHVRTWAGCWSEEYL